MIDKEEFGKASFEENQNFIKKILRLATHNAFTKEDLLLLIKWQNAIIEKMGSCANCKHGNEGEYDCFENCSSCTAMYCICQKTKKEMDWTDKCDEWELAE